MIKILAYLHLSLLYCYCWMVPLLVSGLAALGDLGEMRHNHKVSLSTVSDAVLLFSFLVYLHYHIVFFFFPMFSFYVLYPESLL